MSDEYAEEKRVMNWGGVGLLVIGGILLIFGIINFINFFTNIPSLVSGGSFDSIFSNIFGGIMWGTGLTMVGAIMLGIGIYLIQVANIRRITGYFASETAPATSRMSRAMTRGLRNAGGIPVDQNFDSTPVIKIRCQSCGALNDDLAVQCAHCGRKL